MTDVINALIVMGAGMTGVFLVIILFYLVILILRKIFPAKKGS
jgi:cell division protein FtsW (lipid II flippase)